MPTPPRSPTGAVSTHPLARFLNGNAPKSAKRNDSQLESIVLSCAKEDREQLKIDSLKSYLHLKSDAEKGLTTKFKFFQVLDLMNIESMDEISGIVANTNELFRQMKDRSIDDVFTIPERMVYDDSSDEWVPVASGGFISLKKKYSEITEEHVKRAVAWMQCYGPSYYVENMSWSKNMILNSCTDDLKNKILEDMEQWDEAEKTGPACFYLMMKHILSTSNEALRGVTANLEKLKLTDFDGENVKKACTFLLNVHTLLKDNNMVPKDFNDMAFEMFKSTTCTEFKSKVTSMQGNLEEGLVKYTVPEYLKKLEVYYTTKLGSGKWTAKSTKKGQNSSFAARRIICLNCGEPDHMVKDCDQPIDPAAIARRKKEIFKNPDYKRGKKDSSVDTAKDPNKQPPKSGETHEKTVNGKTLKWCGICGRWGNHSTSEHKSKEELESDKLEKTKTVTIDESANSVHLGATALNF